MDKRDAISRNDIESAVNDINEILLVNRGSGDKRDCLLRLVLYFSSDILVNSNNNNIVNQARQLSELVMMELCGLSCDLNTNEHYFNDIAPIILISGCGKIGLRTGLLNKDIIACIDKLTKLGGDY